MKVLHVIIGLEVGGAELMLARLIESYKDRSGYEHLVISLTDVGKVGERLRLNGIEVLPLGMRSILDFPIVFFRLARLIYSRKPDVVQTWMYHADLIGGLAARVAGFNNVVWGVRTTDLSEGRSKFTYVIRKICALLSSFIPREIVCAAYAAMKSHVLVGYDLTKMTFVSNGFDFNRFIFSAQERTRLREKWGILQSEILIGSVGRFNLAKDPENFINAARIIAKLNPEVKFMLVGRGQSMENQDLVELIADTDLADRFILLGERADIAACMSAMDIFCLHSRTEGFPNVLGEAMAIGLPCVATDVGDAALMLAETGIIVRKENSQALANGILHLLRLSMQERKYMGEAAKKRVTTEYSMSRACEKFEKIYAGISKH